MAEQHEPPEHERARLTVTTTPADQGIQAAAQPEATDDDYHKASES